MKYFGLTEKQLQTLFRYLQSKPYGEVAQIINELTHLPVVDVTEPKPKENGGKPEQAEPAPEGESAGASN